MNNREIKESVINAFKDGNYDRLFSQLSLLWPENSLHQIAWKEFYEADKKLWNQIENSLQKIIELDISELLISIVFWIEQERFINNSDENKEHLAQLYNFAFKHILSAQKTNPIIKDEDSFNTLFANMFASKSSNVLNQYLSNVGEWLKFNSSRLSPFFYDDNFIPIFENGKLNFKYKDEAEYARWQLDGLRYANTTMRYYKTAIQNINQKIINGIEVIKLGQEAENNEINLLLAIKIEQAKIFLMDLNIENLLFKGKPTHINKILQPLQGYSTNRYFRYEEPLAKHSKTSNSWHQSFHKLYAVAIQKGGGSEFPYFYISQNDFCEFFGGAMEEMEAGVFPEIINHFSYDIRPNSKFDRFNIGYNVWETPFIRLDKMLFCPMIFYANNTWFYSIAQRALKILSNDYHKAERKNTSSAMENSLGKLFNSCGWKTKVISDVESSKMDGDIDLFIEDNETQLLIQLKRTQLRLELKDAYMESITVDKKAANQLNDGVRFLEMNPTIFKINSAATKWIVSTSFENVLKDIEGCTKINYFELIWALRNKKFEKLKDFINYITQDGIMKDNKNINSSLDFDLE